MSKNLKKYFLFFLILQQLQFSIQLRPFRRERAVNYKSNDEDYFTMLVSGGTKATNKRTKYVVSIRTATVTAKFGDNHYCTGVIVSGRVIVTAAHCVVDSRHIKTRAKRIHVVAGNNDRLKESKSSVEAEVDRVVVHPDYQRRKKNDIAMLVLKIDLPMNDNLKAIPVAAVSPKVKTVCTVVGWGQLFDKGPYSRWAVETDLKVLKKGDKYCKNIAEGMICAADVSDWERSVCRGDSGSPLICGNNVLHGIASWIENCGHENRSSYFTDISIYRQWILDNGGPHEMPRISKIKLALLAVALQKFCVNVLFL